MAIVAAIDYEVLSSSCPLTTNGSFSVYMGENKCVFFILEWDPSLPLSAGDGMESDFCPKTERILQTTATLLCSLRLVVSIGRFGGLPKLLPEEQHSPHHH